MQNITYVGQFPVVETTLDRKPKIIRQGESVEVSDEQAQALLDQPENWAATVNPSTATVDELRAALAKHNVTAPAKATKAELLSLLDQALALEQAGVTDPPPPNPDPDTASQADPAN